MIVHVLHHGFPLCGFSLKIPREWPKQQAWVSITNLEDANCEDCKDRAAAIVKAQEERSLRRMRSE